MAGEQSLDVQCPNVLNGFHFSNHDLHPFQLMKCRIASALGAAFLAASVPLAAFAKSTESSPSTLVNKVRQAVAASTEPGAKMSPLFAYYVVPPMSNLKRTATTVPEDGILGGPIRIIAAQGEFEPASVVFFPFADVGKMELKVSNLKGKNGTIPASAVDARVVKVWYQTGTAWHSYFADAYGRTLVPELLLHDENLVRVDQKTQDNYLRVDYPKPRGSEYVWISNPYQIQIPFNHFTEPVDDAPALRPFSLTQGEFKQVWLTFEAPKEAEGIYSGTLAVTVDGKPQGAIPLEVRVLPFALPDPKTNYDLNREFYTSIYNDLKLPIYLKNNGGDREGALKRLANEYENVRKHNILYPILLDQYLPGEAQLFTDQFEVYKKAGLRTDAIFGAVPAIPNYGWMTSPEVQGKPVADQPPAYDLFRKMDAVYDAAIKAVGHHNIYSFGWDEPGMRLLVAERGPWKTVHDKGLSTYTTGKNPHLLYGGYNEDFVNYGGAFSKDDAEAWHAMGARITSYANPHTGPENPDFARRAHGFELYRSNADGTNNYMLDGSPWNDFAGVEYNFRSFNLIYPGKERPMDTLQWEGIREGIDDVRYATLLKQLAHQAIETGKTENIYAGKKALLWLATQDPKTVDLNALRMEMIGHILKLKQIHQD